MDISLLRLYRTLVWQAFCSTSYNARQENHFAFALHEVRNLISANDSIPTELLPLLNDILDSAKLQNKGLISKESDFHLLKILLNLEKMYKTKFKEKNIHWIADYNFSSKLVILADMTKLIQVLTNLIGNALKFTEHGSIKITVRALPNHKISFAVKDSGVGISQGHLDNLFSDYAQVPQAQNLTTTSGTGLGLSISKSLVAFLGGNLNAESEVGKGSTFFFTIDYTATAIEKPKHRKLKRALVIDDDNCNLLILSQILTKTSIKCDYCSTLDASLNLCANLPKNYYNLIICDLNINKESGLDLGKILKNYFNIKCPLVLLTASNKKDLADEQMLLIEKIFAGYLTKPFQLSEFYRLITNLSIISPELLKEKFNFAKENDMDLVLNKILEKHRVIFKENYLNSSFTLKSYFAKQEFDDLRVYSHSIKGLSATLGYANLAECASQIELLVLARSEMDKISLAIDNYSEAFNALIS